MQLHSQDGYTKEVRRPGAVQVLVATKAKANQDHKSSLDREFFKSFLEVIVYLQTKYKYLV